MKRYWLLLILPVLLLIWWGVDHGGSAPLLHFATVRRTRIESMVSTNGKVEPAEWAAARAETAGVVRSISVHQGQDVRDGQPLVELDTTAARAELAAALAREQEARAESATLKQGGKAAQLASLNDSIKSAQSTEEVAQRNYDALQRLESQHAATKLQVQEARDALNRAKLQLSAFQDQKRTLVTSSDRTVAEAKLHDAQAAVALARRRVSLGQVSAPISGTVYQFDLKIGAYLQPGELVALVGDINDVKVTVYVDEPDLGRVGLNMPVSITWDARPGQKWWGRVDKLPTQVVSLQARTVGEVTTIVNNPNHDLLPGVTVNATIISKVENNTLSIPKAALRTIRGSTGVYRLEGDSLAWTSVKTGISDINNVQILSGLQPGDRVTDRVIEPSDAEITNGMRVRAAID
ncbi:MAG TPA: efflux RND transporter periplasmic adaptor subunit [Bryobacteraceae bacterium]|jgi:HlyD family secretion protein